jgi:DNA mismatch repair protein MutS
MVLLSLMCLIDDYLNYCRKYEAEFGSNTAVFIEVGSFMEVYGLDLPDQQVGKIREITKILNIALTRKTKFEPHSRKNPLMAGVTSPAFYKYAKMLLANGFTVIEVRQVTPPPSPKREVTEIHSPGVSLSTANLVRSNFLFLIYAEEIPSGKNKTTLFLGVAKIDVTTGESWVSQTCRLDQLQGELTRSQPRELVIYGDLPDLHVPGQLVHRYDPPESVNKISYRNEFLRKFFPSTGVVTPIEWLSLERHDQACIALVLTLEFVEKHNPKLLKSLQPPTLIVPEELLTLDASSLMQLQVVPDKNATPIAHRVRGLTDLLDCTCTAPGKRQLYRQLTAPIRDPAKLEKRYDLIESMFEISDLLRDGLKHVYDLDRMHRKVALQLLTPGQFVNLERSYAHVLEVFELCYNLPLDIAKTEASLHEMRNYYLSKLDIDQMEGFGLNDIERCFFKPGVEPTIDALQKQDVNIMKKIEAMALKVSKFIEPKKKASIVYVKSNDRDGYYLSTTTKRSQTLTKAWPKHPFQIKKHTNTAKLFSDELRALSNQKIVVAEKLKSAMRRAYLDLLEEMCMKWNDCMLNSQRLVAEIDAYQSLAFCAKKYKYCRPKLVKKDTGFITCKGLRHPIIEQIQRDQEYIPNDVTLGDDHRGLMIYGCNSSGKSSLMKALGLAVIMAQAGSWVPCSDCEMTPFDQLFTRISGDDDLLNGHSSFVVELLELRNILERATSSSLVLSDELSRGTEATSGVAIVSSTVVQLAERRSCFMSATHLHELNRIKQVTENTDIGHFHLEVDTHPTEDKLIYNRKLQPGSGDPIYGLRIARNIVRNQAFLDLAEKIQEEIMGNERLRTSNYSKDFFLGRCELCTSPAEECHHIKFQCTADKQKYIGNYHKNRQHNLVALCKSCHLKVHQSKIQIEGWVMTETGKELMSTAQM